MIPKLFVITLLVSLALAHPQYNPSEGVETGAISKSQCGHPSYDCVPYYQCQNGVINTDGEGLIEVRVKPQGTCENPDYPDAPSICCLIPGQPATSKPLEICPADGLCVDKNKCSADGYIVEDVGAGSLIDIRSDRYSCIKADDSLGVCCTPKHLDQCGKGGCSSDSNQIYKGINGGLYVLLLLTTFLY